MVLGAEVPLKQLNLTRYSLKILFVNTILNQSLTWDAATGSFLNF